MQHRMPGNAVTPPGMSTGGVFCSEFRDAVFEDVVFIIVCVTIHNINCYHNRW